VERATQVETPSFRWKDFADLPEDDARELIDGRLVEIDLPSKLHEWVVSVLVRLLGNWAAEHGGMALPSGYKVRISDDRGVMADVQFLRKGNIAAHGARGMEAGHPDLVVEVISETSRSYDRVVKLGFYASIGVPEYWIVDPEAKTLERLVLDGSTYRVVEALADDQTFAPASFAGFSVSLRSLWVLPE
jgi:Uma2 family endonuclease